MVEKNPVAMMRWVHLFPYRTQKLSTVMQTIVGRRRPVKICRCRILYEEHRVKSRCFLFYVERLFNEFIIIYIFENFLRNFKPLLTHVYLFDIILISNFSESEGDCEII